MQRFLHDRDKAGPRRVALTGKEEASAFHVGGNAAIPL